MVVKKESLGVGHVPRKTSAIACYYRLELLQLYTVIAIIIPTIYSRVDLKIVSYTFSHMAVHLHAKACAVITNSTLMQGNFMVYHSL